MFLIQTFSSLVKYYTGRGKKKKQKKPHKTLQDVLLEEINQLIITAHVFTPLTPHQLANGHDFFITTKNKSSFLFIHF